MCGDYTYIFGGKLQNHGEGIFSHTYNHGFLMETDVRNSGILPDCRPRRRIQYSIIMPKGILQRTMWYSEETHLIFGKVLDINISIILFYNIIEYKYYTILVCSVPASSVDKSLKINVFSSLLKHVQSVAQSWLSSAAIRNIKLSPTNSCLPKWISCDDNSQE